jgi:hypothetical protein
MKPREGTGRFQWNAGGWFGSQVGSTLWLFILAYLMAPTSTTAAAWLAGCAVAPNLLGGILWMKRDRLAPYLAIQCLVAAVGVVTLLAFLVADHLRVLPILDSRFMNSPQQAYWVLCLFPVTMAHFAYMEHATSKRNKTGSAEPGAAPNAAPSHR